MKTKHVITIGILSAIAVALLGIAVALGKVNKPKTLQTNAEFYVNSYTYEPNNNSNWQIQGTPSRWQLRWQVDSQNYADNPLIGSYRITKNSNQLWYTWISTKVISSEDYEMAYSPYLTDARQPYTQAPLTRIKILQSCDVAKYVDDDTLEELQDVTWYIKFQFIYNDNHIDTYTLETELTRLNQSTYYMDSFSNYEVENIPIEQTFYLYNYNYQDGALTAGDALEVLPIRNMMLEILTMPFTFINQAFNVTLWQGTAYAINIGNFIKGILAILAIVFIIKLFTTGLSVLGNYIPDVKNKKQKSKPTLANKTKEKVMKKHDAKVEKKMNDGFRRG